MDACPNRNCRPKVGAVVRITKRPGWHYDSTKSFVLPMVCRHSQSRDLDLRFSELLAGKRLTSLLVHDQVGYDGHWRLFTIALQKQSRSKKSPPTPAFIRCTWRGVFAGTMVVQSVSTNAGCELSRQRGNFS